MVTTVQALAGLGVVLSIPHFYRIASFIWLYFLRPSSIHNYLHGDIPYALVTGATDGIGKATAAELLRRGFNLVLHGRNEQKMQKVVEELRARVPGKANADIRYFLADVSKPDHDFAKMIEPFQHLHITLVIHNVGGSDLYYEKIDERTEEAILGAIRKNALFPLFLTRVLLPHLRRTARAGPVNVQFVGSIAGDVAPPRLAIYAASKRFLEGLVRGLDNDELYFDGATGVRFSYLPVGSVHSDNHEVPMAASFRTPTSDAFGRAIVARTGCGRRRVSPYAIHSMVSYFVGLVSDHTIDEASSNEMHGLLAKARKGD